MILIFCFVLLLIEGGSNVGRNTWVLHMALQPWVTQKDLHYSVKLNRFESGWQERQVLEI